MAYFIRWPFRWYICWLFLEFVIYVDLCWVLTNFSQFKIACSLKFGTSFGRKYADFTMVRCYASCMKKIQRKDEQFVRMVKPVNLKQIECNQRKFIKTKKRWRVDEEMVWRFEKKMNHYICASGHNKRKCQVEFPILFIKIDQIWTRFVM
jgi:hypothetical protein